jgi:hypothetical protein
VPRAVKKPTTVEWLTLSEARALLTTAYRLPRLVEKRILEAVVEDRVRWRPLDVDPPGPIPSDFWQRLLELTTDGLPHEREGVDWSNSMGTVLSKVVRASSAGDFAFEYVAVTVEVAPADIEKLLPADYKAPADPQAPKDWLWDALDLHPNATNQELFVLMERAVEAGQLTGSWEPSTFERELRRLRKGK